MATTSYPSQIENLASPPMQPSRRRPAFAPRRKKKVPKTGGPLSAPRKVCLALTFASGHQLPGDEVLAHLAQAGLSKFDMPEYLLPVDAMPMTASGKILKRDLSASVRAGKLSPHPSPLCGGAGLIGWLKRLSWKG